jgi:hypothetical protein
MALRNPIKTWLLLQIDSFARRLILAASTRPADEQSHSKMSQSSPRFEHDLTSLTIDGKVQGVRRYVLAQQGLPSTHPLRRFTKIPNRQVFDPPKESVKTEIQQSPWQRANCLEKTGAMAWLPTADRKAHIAPHVGQRRVHQRGLRPWTCLCGFRAQASDSTAPDDLAQGDLHKLISH